MTLEVDAFLEDDFDFDFERGRSSSSSDSVSSERSDSELSRLLDFPFRFLFLRLSSSDSEFASESLSFFDLCLRFFFDFGSSVSSSLSLFFRERFFVLLLERSSAESLSSESSDRRRFRLLDSLVLFFKEHRLRFLELERSSSLSPELELGLSSDSIFESHAENANAGIYTTMSRCTKTQWSQ